MRSSLRWTVVAWYGLLLAAVVAIFCVVLHARVAGAVMAGVDATLESRARAILGALDWDERDGWELDLSDEHLAGLTEGGWYVLVDAEGADIRRKGAVPARALEASAGFASFVEERSFSMVGLRGARLWIGRSIASELAAQREFQSAMLGIGVGLLALALIGGWWLTTRALRPIESISRTARTLSERDLSARIDDRSVPVELRGLAGALNDAFERLQRAFERERRFTADASHELRTPLSVIRSQAELSLRRDRDGADYRAALAVCLRSAERMSGTVEGLLALARADAGERALELGEVALDEVAAEACADARLESETAEVALQLDAEPTRVRGDAALLREVVANLVSNAVRYNRPGGRVDVRVRSDGDRALLEVADDGLGIPADALPHVFERFYRVDPARSRERGGSGLGLAITRWIVGAHGGSIEVASRVGFGATFTVRLASPRRAEAAEVDAHAVRVPSG